jgi:DNA (cytosine-5)-methyltransferase 1
MHMKPTAIDLFAGAGGLTLGLRRAGFDVRGAVEIDALAATTYRRNHPRVRVWEQDIRDIDPLGMARELGVAPGELDVLAGCPPCQGFSSVRTLNGARPVTDDRNGLVAEFARFAAALRPRSVMFENVPGLAQDRRLRDLQSALSEVGLRTRPTTAFRSGASAW